MDWFRSYHGAPLDAKLVTVAKRSETQPGVACAIWWALLDYASQHTDRGSVAGFDCEFVATFFDWPLETVERVVDAMRAKGMLTDDRIASWEKRQPAREDYSTDRVRRFRDKQKGDGNAAQRSETHGNARVDESRTEEMREGDEEHAPVRSVLHLPGEMERQKDAAAQPAAGIDPGRAVALAAERERRKRAEAWGNDHPEELEKIRRAVDREIGQREPSPMRTQIRTGMIIGKILEVADRSKPAAAPREAIAV